MFEHLDHRAVLADFPTERRGPTEEATALFLVRGPFTNTVALGLGKGYRDRDTELCSGRT